MTRRFGIASRCNAAARSRSISIATTRPARAASGRVSAPRPGPISRKVSSFDGWMPSTTFATHAVSRKCCPKRLRGLFILTTPVALFDLLDFLFAEAEVVTDLVYERLADHRPDVV